MISSLVIYMVILHSPVRMNMVVCKRGVKHGGFLKEAGKYGLKRINIYSEIVMKLNMHHSVVIVTEEVVHFIPKLCV